MRVGPHLAPSIVDATMDAETPALLVVRGDALLATGHATEAADAYAAAATALGIDVPAEAAGASDADAAPETDAAPDADGGYHTAPPTTTAQ